MENDIFLHFRGLVKSLILIQPKLTYESQGTSLKIVKIGEISQYKRKELTHKIYHHYN